MFICVGCLTSRFKNIMTALTPRSVGVCEICDISRVCCDINSKRLVKKYPESEKLQASGDKNLVIGEFLDFLEGKSVVLCKYDNRHYGGVFPKPLQVSKESIICQFLGVDEKALEEEHKDMLREQKDMDAMERIWKDMDERGRTRLYEVAVGGGSKFIHAVWGDMSLADRTVISRYHLHRDGN